MPTDVTSSFTPPIGAEGRPAIPGPQGEIERERFNMYTEAMADLASRGWNPASVINLHPFKLYTTGVKLKELRIPGVPRDLALWNAAPKIKLRNGVEVPYVRHSFLTPDVDVCYYVAGSASDPMASSKVLYTMPEQFATDVLQQNNNPRTRGGVFCYVGDHEPLSKKATYDVELDRFERAHAQQIMFYNSLLEEANNAESEGSKTHIREARGKYHRWATIYLRLMGLIPEYPKWFTEEIKSGEPVSKACVACGHDAKIDALRCTNGTCTYIFEPFTAYKAGVFDEDSPGGALALRRCTKEQLVELGLYPLIRPQAEHVKQRAKEQAK